jgi:hypothetical protein
MTEKPGRNEPCWCGSGKKYKKYHYLIETMPTSIDEAPYWIQMRVTEWERIHACVSLGHLENAPTRAACRSRIETRCSATTHRMPAKSCR